MSPRSSSVFSPESLTLGICLVALGVLWMLSNLGQLELVPVLRSWWPAALVLWGVLELVDLGVRRARRQR
jgi:hypothetical protein